MKRMGMLVGLVLLLCSLPEPLRAEEGGPKGDAVQVTLGGISLLRPQYEGDSSYEVQTFPLLDIRIERLFFLNVREGLGLRVLERRGFSVSAALGYRFGRDEDDSAALAGMGDVEGGAIASLAARWKLGSYALFLRGEQSVGPHPSGVLMKLGVVRRVALPRRWSLFAALQAEGGDSRYLQQFFGVTRAQAGTSRYAPYDIDAGLKSLGGSARLLRNLGDHWGLQLIFGADRLLGDAAASPLVREKFPLSLGAGLSYRF